MRINYFKSWDSEGYCTHQNVYISAELYKRFKKALYNRNNYLKKKYKIFIPSEVMDEMMYSLPLKKHRCLTQTQLRKLVGFLLCNNIKINKLKLGRNTMLYTEGK